MNYTKLKCFAKSCYCKIYYTSNNSNNKQKKRNDAFAHTVVSKRLLKSQCSEFVFKRDCLLCGNVCKMKDSKNPHRWVEYNQQLENLYDERGPVGE